jgi:hypothetical protein
MDDLEKIDEAEIMKKMEIEIGENFGVKRKKEEEKSPDKKILIKTPKDYIKDSSYNVSVSVRSGSKISGNVILAQKNIVLYLKSRSGVSIRSEIPLQQIQTIKFSNWDKSNQFIAGNINRVYILPAICSILTRDKKQYRGKCDLQDWLQLNIKEVASGFHLRVYQVENKSSIEEVALKNDTATKKELDGKLLNDMVTAIEFLAESTDSKSVLLRP